MKMNFDSRGQMIGEDKVDAAGNVLTSYRLRGPHEAFYVTVVNICRKNSVTDGTPGAVPFSYDSIGRMTREFLDWLNSIPVGTGHPKDEDDLD
jgi:hypothetical protein